MFGEKNGIELVFLAAFALIVIGPKDLPRVLRKVGQFTAKMRGLAAEFRASFEELARQSELDELRKEVEALRQGQLGMADHQVEIEREFDELQHSMNLLPGSGSYPAPLSLERDYVSVEADEDQPDLPFHAEPAAEPEAGGPPVSPAIKSGGDGTLGLDPRAGGAMEGEGLRPITPGRAPQDIHA